MAQAERVPATLAMGRDRRGGWAEIGDLTIFQQQSCAAVRVFPNQYIYWLDLTPTPLQVDGDWGALMQDGWMANERLSLFV